MAKNTLLWVFQYKVTASKLCFAEPSAGVASLHVPTLVVQEGGYYLEELEANAVSFFEGLLSRE
ncbi:hypothetical protein ACQKE4_09545 [Halomonas sp. NPDC076908]|uniref:hypothetical protein n=1 Tax=Halomonas sp. NPDC076908 TaxID=3390567 RepID=UPI003D00635F